MRRAIAVAATAGVMVAVTSTAQADWSASAGFENFKWKESATPTSPTVSESGMRWALDLSWTQTREPGISAGYNLKYYVGNVDRTGSTFGAAGVSGETHYRGLTNEVQSIYRAPKGVVDVVLAAGWDHWDRELGAVQQTWDVIYARIGVGLNTVVRQGLIGSAGVKYPIYARENAGFTGAGANENPRVRPGRDVSFYGSLGYRINPHWDVIGYYDSFRFKQSNTVSVTTAGGPVLVAQPQSKQDVVGMKIQHNF